MERLIGVVRDYAWGDRRFIAELQGRPPGGGPEAELWLGDHPSAPSPIPERGVTLDRLVADDPVATLGPGVANRYGAVPYLLKVLAAAEPLSIQAHPSAEQARAGFAREEAAGIPGDAPERTYRDPNPKPEVIAALTDFEAKCGFRPLADTARLLAALAGATAGADSTGAGTGPAGPTLTIADLAARCRTGAAGGADAGRQAARSLVADVLGLDPVAAKTLVAATVAAAEHLIATGLPPALEIFRPELAWTPRLDAFYPGDPGVVVALLLNHVTLRPGQAMFLPAGNLHAYLVGAGVELMANSDNVVRGGLTPKHVDVAELVTVLDPGDGPAPVQTPTGPVHRYHLPIPEFSLTRLAVDRADRLDHLVRHDGIDLLLVTAGTVRLTVEPERRGSGAGGEMVLAAGETAVVWWSDGPYRIRADGPAMAWRASSG
ncbi:MAG: mannose-6-phosphate isomerase, class I [Acidimicrobiales bacterium]